MRPVLTVCVIGLLLLSSAVVLAAESPAPGTGPTINPITRPPDDEDRGPVSAIGGYLWNRFRDLADVVTLKFGWGTDKSIGFQLRACRPLQIGAGIFEGYVFAIDRGCVGVMKEAEIEGGISIWYPTFVARRIVWQSKEAERRNVFFGQVAKEGALSVDALKPYYDGNQGWLTSTLQAQLPYLPKIEVTVHWGEIPDFFLSFFGISGFRVPPPFHKQDGPDGERIPAPSIFWHGQEERYKTYE